MTTENTKKMGGNMMVAVAIIIAALIIGAAVVFTNDKGDNNAQTEETNIEGLDFIRGISEDDHIKGDINAPIKIIEFSDTECPFCGRIHSTLDEVVSESNGQVAWIYRHLPLVQLHTKAPTEAHATECAAELGGNDGFWKYIDHLYEITPGNNGLDLELLPEIAEFAGINKDEFTSCMDEQRHLSKIEEDYTEGASLLQFLSTQGIQAGTPTSIVISPDGEMIPVNGAQPKEAWMQIISELMAE